MKKALFIFFLLFSVKSYASHVIGGEITYKNLNGDTFEIYLSIISDCALQTAHPLNPTITVSGACPSFNIVMQADSVLPNGNPYQQFLEHGCSSAIAAGQSYCQNGTLPGYRKSTYTGTAVLPYNCGGFRLGYQYACCPPPMVNVSQINTSVYVETQIQIDGYNLNSSPKPHAKNFNPLFYLNQNASLDLGFEDIDGDSLVYEFYAPQTGVNQWAVFNQGYNFLNPISGATIDSLSGLIQFTPNIAGNFRLCIKVSEYDVVTHSLKGWVVKDFMVQVAPNSNNNQTNALTDVQSALIQRSFSSPVFNKHIKVCFGDTLHFEFSVKDPNGNHLEITSNISKILPNANLNLSPSFTSDSVHIVFSWVANQNFNYRKFLRIGIVDDFCSLRGYSDEVYAISVINTGTISGNSIIEFCPQDTINLTGNVASNHYWQSINNTSNILGCDTCKNVTLQATSSDTILYTALVNGLCQISDTSFLVLKQTQSATIHVVDSFCNNSQPHWENTATPKGGVWIGLKNTDWGLSLPDTAGGWRTIKYAITDSVCGLPDTASKNVYLVSAAIVVWTDSFEVCQGDTAIFVNTSIPPATSPIMGTTNGWFNPKIAQPGNNPIYFSILNSSQSCITTARNDVFVHPKPILIFSSIPPICESEDSLKFTQGKPVGGSYFFDTLQTNWVSPKILGAGAYQVGYTYQNTAGCVDSIYNQFTIDTIPPKPEILLVGKDTLMPSVVGDYCYWFLNGTKLSNQSNMLTGLQTGVYEVVVVKNTCESEKSARFNYDPLSIESVTESKFSLFPNPTNQYFFIEGNLKYLKSLELINMAGQALIIKTGAELSTPVDVSHLPKGVYFVSLVDQSNTKWNFKMSVW